MNSPVTVGLAVFALVLGAGVLPLFFKLSQRTLHAVVAVASGFFLGVTFLHLLPEVAHQGTSPLMWGSVLAGLLAVFFAEVLLRQDEPHHYDGEHAHGHAHAHPHATLPVVPAAHEHPAHHGAHRVVGIATFVGLAVHTFGGALGIGLAFDQPELRGVLVTATLSHKAAEAFSLVSVLLLAELSRRSILGLLTAYALVTPAGIAIGRLFSSRLPENLLGLAEGLAAGTFLYVAVAELLPEVFHGRRDRGLKIFLLLSGIGVAALLFSEHVHEH